MLLQSTNINVEVSLYRRVCCQFKIISSAFSNFDTFSGLSALPRFPFSCSPSVSRAFIAEKESAILVGAIVAFGVRVLMYTCFSIC